MSDKKPDPALQNVRDCFPYFYAKATQTEAEQMDELVFTWGALVHGMSEPREAMPEEIRRQWEHLCDSAEQKYMAARDAVRRSHRFRKLLPSEQKQIAGVLFSPFLPTE